MKGFYNGDFAALEKEAIIRRKDFKYIEQDLKCCYFCKYVYLDYAETYCELLSEYKIYGAEVSQFGICNKFEEG